MDLLLRKICHNRGRQGSGPQPLLHASFAAQNRARTRLTISHSRHCHRRWGLVLTVTGPRKGGRVGFSNENPRRGRGARRLSTGILGGIGWGLLFFSERGPFPVEKKGPFAMKTPYSHCLSCHAGSDVKKELPLGPKLLHYITLFFRINFPDYVMIL